MENINKIIEDRRSVRTFKADKPLADATVAKLQTAIDDSTSPFGGKVEVRLKKFDIKGNFKPSTYGTISGASWYFLMGTDGSETAQLTLGFRMEQVVLQAASLGLGTCWIAATFKGTTFAGAAQFSDDIPLQIVMPVGYPAERKSLRESLVRAAVGSARRKPMTDLFIVDAGSKFYEPLAMMRLAPSSTNSQPWRAEVVDDTVYFYYEKKSAVSILDLGIGLSHFYLSAKEKGITGDFTICTDAPTHKNWIPLVKFQTK